MRWREVSRIVAVLLAACLQFAPAHAADDAASPFGLRFGMPAEAVPYTRLGDVERGATGPSCYVELVRLYDDRVLPTLVSTGIATPHDKIIDSLASAVRVRLERVGVTAGYYRIRVADRDRRVCLGFHRDRLYLISIARSEIPDLLPGLPAELDGKLRRVQVYCRSDDCWRAWVTSDESILVTLRGPDITGQSGTDDWILRQGALSYTATRIKAEQSKALIEAYDNLIESQEEDRKAQKGRVLEDIKKGFGFDK
ncbi:MAG: hypothetical protein CMM50_11080 [Rhodospirillaceae bacterium]|nr:hypothetical protein [Rhodospirillaceae bacterium]